MNRKSKDFIRRSLWVLFIIYIIGLTYFLFFNERATGEEYRYNLQLFKEINRFIRYRNVVGFNNFILNIAGNIFAFSPFGFMLPVISPKNRKFLNVALLCFEFTLSVELLQLLLKVGIFDVDDIFMNLCGGIIGYSIFAVCMRLIRRK